MLVVNSSILRKAQGDSGKTLKRQYLQHLMFLIGIARWEELPAFSSLDSQCGTACDWICQRPMGTSEGLQALPQKGGRMNTCTARRQPRNRGRVVSASPSCKGNEGTPGSCCNFLPGWYFWSSLPPWVFQWVWKLPCGSHGDFGDFLLGQEDIVPLLFNGMRVDFQEKSKTHLGLVLKSFAAMENPAQPLISCSTFIYPS